MKTPKYLIFLVMNKQGLKLKGKKDFVNECAEVVYNEKSDGIVASDAVKTSPNMSMEEISSPGDTQPCLFKSESLPTELTKMPNNKLDQISNSDHLLSSSQEDLTLPQSSSIYSPSHLQPDT